MLPPCPVDLPHLQLSSSTRSSGWQTPTRALFSIRPEYAAAIFDGRKRFEFRRSVFRRAVTTVIVYVTKPVGMVVGEFDVEGVIQGGVQDLWEHTQEAAGIDRERFLNYF